MKQTRRPIILLEVFLALAILGIALIPLTSYPYQYFAKEKNLLCSIEKERLYDVCFREVQILLQKKFSFADINTTDPIEVDLSDQIILEKLHPCKARIMQKLPKKETLFSNKKSYKLIDCEVFIGKNSQTRKLLVSSSEK